MRRWELVNIIQNHPHNSFFAILYFIIIVLLFYNSLVDLGASNGQWFWFGAYDPIGNQENFQFLDGTLYQRSLFYHVSSDSGPCILLQYGSNNGVPFTYKHSCTLSAQRQAYCKKPSGLALSPITYFCLISAVSITCVYVFGFRLIGP